MPYRKSPTNNLAIGLLLTLCLAVAGIAFAASTVQQSSLGLNWVEGANIKINSDLTTGLQNEEACAINPVNPDNAVAIWRDFRLGYRRIGVGTTFNGGATWSDSLMVGTLAYPRASDPVMSYTAGGDILACLLALTADESVSAIHVYQSTNGGASWSAQVDAVDEGGGSGFEDKQWINVDRTTGPFRDRVYIPWTRFGANSQIMLVHSVTPTIYSSPVKVSDVGGVQWSTVTVGPDGTVYVAWISWTYGQIMIDKSADGGDTWGVDRSVTGLGFMSTNINGGIMVFAYPAMEADISGGVFDGTVYTAYSNVAADGDLDLYIRRSFDQGYSWLSPVRINDDPVGNNVDQFHPWISVNEDGILTASWFDRRLDPSNYNWDLYMSHSFDGGATWTANRRISEVSSSPSDAAQQFVKNAYAGLTLTGKPAGGQYEAFRNPMAGLIGEYTGLSTRGGVAQTVWTDTRNGNQDAYSARMTIGFSAPPLVSPAQNAATNNAHPIFSWGKTGATPAEIALFPGTKVQPLHYIVQVDDDSLFASINYADSGIVATSHEFSGALADGIWFWCVSAVNDSGRNTGFAEPHRKLIVDTQAPTLPTIIKPEADSTVEYQSQTYQWTAVSREAMGAPVSYQLQVSTDSTFATVAINVSNLTANTYTNSTPLTGGKTYYCRVKATDAATNTSGFTLPQRFHTKKAFLCGDADGNGTVNVSDVVYLIAFVFAGGPAPNPLAAGDVDCSGILNVSDVVYLISYVFAGGAVPCAACK